MHVWHELLPRDFQRRLNFARWLTEQCRRNENFLRNFVVGDEATFCMNGRVNSRNVRAYCSSWKPSSFQLRCELQPSEMDILALFVWKWTRNWSVFFSRKKCKRYKLFAALRCKWGAHSDIFGGFKMGPSTSSLCCYCSLKRVVW